MLGSLQTFKLLFVSNGNDLDFEDTDKRENHRENPEKEAVNETSHADGKIMLRIHFILFYFIILFYFRFILWRVRECALTSVQGGQGQRERDSLKQTAR